MPPILRYSLARAALFAAALGVLYLVGLRGLLLFGVAVLVSGLASYVVLARQRDDVSRRVTSRIDRARQAIDERSRAEDEE